jgi:hypothetical protein
MTRNSLRNVCVKFPPRLRLNELNASFLKLVIPWRYQRRFLKLKLDFSTGLASLETLKDSSQSNGGINSILKMIRNSVRGVCAQSPPAPLVE